MTREIAVVLRHFFPSLADWLDEVGDPRASDQSVYQFRALLLLGVLMFLTHAGSRNHFNDNLRDAREMARTLARMLGCELDALPHLDTLEKVLRRLSPESLDGLLPRMIRRLIRMKALDSWRVGGRFLLAVDGTGMYSFRKRHCAHCIEARHSSGTVTYSHSVLVAFLVNTEGYALPVGYEWVENPGTHYEKQDCEIKAFRRLEPKLKRAFPQTAFWLLLDALYADQGVLRSCLANAWNCAITFLPSDMPALWAEAQRLLALSPGQRAEASSADRTKRTVRWVNDLDYEGMKLSAVYQTDRDANGTVVHEFAHLTLRWIDVHNVWKTAAAARLRWRCENQGFNVLKNGGFALEHVYSRNRNAARSYFVLMLCAHLLQQLLTRGQLGSLFESVFHTFLHYGKKLMAALMNEPLPSDLNPPGQIRLSSA